MCTDMGVTVTVAELHALCHAVAANPPDGSIALTNDDQGAMRAGWKYKGQRASIGGPDPVPVPG